MENELLLDFKKAVHLRTSAEVTVPVFVLLCAILPSFPLESAHFIQTVSDYFTIKLPLK